MHPAVNIAVRAARAAGNIIARNIDRVSGLDIALKGANDFVTEVDRRAEAVIIDTIHRSYPDHGILAEESGVRDGDDNVWIIDPLDGTTNFLHGFPQYAVSIAHRHKGRLENAVIYNPVSHELFTATRGAGAMLDDRRIRVSNREGLDGALLGTGFPFREGADIDTFLDTFRAMHPRAAGIRRAGSAALDLAFVAAGRLDGFWEFGLKEWDMAAGVLLIQEAGGLVSDMQGGHGFLETGDIVCGAPKVFRDMLKAITPVVRRAPDDA